MQQAGIDAGLDHGGLLAAMGLGEALGPGAGLVVLVPVEGFRQHEALRRLQAERVDVAEEDEETGEPVDVDADDEEYGLVIMKTVEENGEELLSTLDSDEEIEEVYNLFMERFFEDEDE